MEDPRAVWMELSSGARFHFLPNLGFADPPDLYLDFCLPLARLLRFTGHGKSPWSVALHTLVAAEYARMRGFRPSAHLDVLLHDFPEAIFGDLSTPLKGYLFGHSGDQKLKSIETLVDNTLRKALGVGSYANASPDRVRAADLASLRVEAVESMPSAGHGWPVMEEIDLTAREQVTLLAFAREFDRDPEIVADVLKAEIETCVGSINWPPSAQ